MENELGKYLKNIRKTLKLSLKDVEEKTQISASYIYRLEKGERCNPSAFTLKTLSDFYGANQYHMLKLATYSCHTKPYKENKIDNIFEDSQITFLLIKLLERIEILSHK
ncbi:helix-turn-helix domain-containing protein [Clostridium hydrogenum]|uniref:helix-turn-helix domain-containing protein n=1 Tax=Clostridium hydrogenum TaxID=2855764 RepID=UPI001F2A94C8|nr:helix-turn-helix transcriptional regulator [Clostridium hydrogenum]